MQTYNRSWAQGGTPGYYAMYSTNQENGYVYFVGSGTTTGAPLNRLTNITHAFTRIDVVAPVNDMISLYKAKVKATTEFANALASFASFPSVISSSGNFVLPNNALPLVNVMLHGGGGGGGRHAGGGGAGAGIVKLTAYQAVGTTSVTVGGGGGGQHRSASNEWGGSGSATFFGNVYALGGGGGAPHAQTANNSPFTPSSGHANGGGGGSHNGAGSGGSGTTQTSTTGLGTTGSPVYFGGNAGGAGRGGTHEQAGGGAGAGGPGGQGGGTHAGVANGGIGHSSDITGTTQHYCVGGSGGVHGTSGTRGPGLNFPTSGWANIVRGNGGFGGAGDTAQSGTDGGNDTRGYDGGPGAVIVRYYIP